MVAYITHQERTTMRLRGWEKENYQKYVIENCLHSILTDKE